MPEPDSNVVNSTLSSVSVANNGSASAEGQIHEFHVIKAIVLISVIVILLLSTCKVLFRLFVQYIKDKE